MTLRNNCTLMFRYPICYQQITLATTIASTNSNIPAGVASFNPFLHNQSEETQMIESLQKCSDREAKIYFTQTWQDTKKIKELDSENLKSSKAYNLNKAMIKNSSSYSKLQQRDEGFRSTSKDRQITLGSLMNESRVKAYNNLPSRYPSNQQETINKPRVNVAYSAYNTENSQRRQNALKSQVEMLNL